MIAQAVVRILKESLMFSTATVRPAITHNSLLGRWSELDIASQGCELGPCKADKWSKQYWTTSSSRLSAMVINYSMENWKKVCLWCACWVHNLPWYLFMQAHVNRFVSPTHLAQFFQLLVRKTRFPHWDDCVWGSIGGPFSNTFIFPVKYLLVSKY